MARPPAGGLSGRDSHSRPLAPGAGANTAGGIREHRRWHSRGVSDLDDLRQRMRVFTTERDWEQFHDPKSLILAIVGEVGELSELFQWLPATDAQNLARVDPLKSRVAEEMSDVLLYLVRLADVLGIDLHTASVAKIEAAGERFTAEDVRGTAPTKS